jgi:DGQHR domain-containing protein
MLVPVTAFVSDDYEVHRTQFLLVNKVQPLPGGLINELLPTVNTTLPPSLSRNRIPSAICDILSRDPGSPFYGLIIRQTTDRRTNKAAVVADNSILQMVRASLNSVHGCLYPCRNAATGEVDVEQIRRILNLFWGAVRAVFPDAWGKPPTKSRLMHGAGIRAMGVLMDRIMNSVALDDIRATETVKAALVRIKPQCAWTTGEWVALDGIAWNGLQNTPRDIQLLTNMLVREHLGLSRP